MENEVKIFSMKGCPHCDNLKNKLKENNIDFIELDIDEKEKYLIWKNDKIEFSLYYFEQHCYKLHFTIKKN